MRLKAAGIVHSQARRGKIRGEHTRGVHLPQRVTENTNNAGRNWH